VAAEKFTLRKRQFFIPAFDFHEPELPATFVDYQVQQAIGGSPCMDHRPPERGEYVRHVVVDCIFFTAVNHSPSTAIMYDPACTTKYAKQQNSAAIDMQTNSSTIRASMERSSLRVIPLPLPFH
jgi:hypothetical protein